MKSNLPSISRNMLLSFLTLVLLLLALPWAISAQADPLDDIEGGSATYATQGGYVVVDTGQTTCYDNTSPITCPGEGEAFYGQDAQHAGNQPSYVDNGDGTVTDLNTGLMWQQTYSGKMTWDDALAEAETFSLAGYDDWLLPTIKELYSLIDFGGVDPSGYQGSDTSGLVPFIYTDSEISKRP